MLDFASIFRNGRAGAGDGGWGGWRGGGRLAYRREPPRARGGAVQRGGTAGSGAVRAGAGAGVGIRLDRHRTAFRGGLPPAVRGQPVRVSRVPDLRARPRPQRLRHGVAWLRPSLGRGSRAAQRHGWLERGNYATVRSDGLAGGGTYGCGAPQDSGRRRARREFAGVRQVAIRRPGLVRGRRRVNPSGRRGRIVDGPPPGKRVGRLSGGAHGGLAVLFGLPRRTRGVETARRGSGVPFRRRGRGLRGLHPAGRRGAFPVGALQTSAQRRKQGAADAVDGECGQAGGPQTGSNGDVPEEGEQHRKAERAESVEADGRAPVAFGQLKQRPRETAQRAGAAREPVKTAERERRVGGGSEAPKRPEEERHRRNAPQPGQRVSTVRGSKPTMSR